MAHGQGGAEIGFDRGPCLTCNHEAPIAAYSTKLHNTQSNQAGKLYEEYTTSLDANSPPPAVFAPATTHTLRGEGFDASEDGTGMGTPLVPVAFAQNSRDELRLEGGDGSRTGALTSGGGKPGQGVPMIAFHPTQDPISSENVCHSIGANDNATAAVAFQPRHYSDRERMGGEPSEVCHTLSAAAGQGDSSPHVATAMQVRRLTPVECERLQGFPDNYTAIPWRKKPASECPDGPRYKALGNSWAVPNVRWIGQRIDLHLMGLL